MSDQDLLDLQFGLVSPVLEEPPHDEDAGEQSQTPEPIGTTISSVQEPVNIINATLTPSKRRSRRQTASETDKEIKKPKPIKKQKLSGLDTKPSTTPLDSNSQKQTGKLSRPTQELIARGDTRSEGKNIFDISDDSSADEEKSSQTKIVRSAQTQKPPTVNGKSELTASSLDEGRKRRGRPPKSSDLPANGASEGAGRTLRSKNPPIVASPSTPPPASEPRPQRTRSAKSPAAASAPASPSNSQAENDDQPDDHQNETEDGPSLGEKVSPAKDPGPVPLQEPAATQTENNPEMSDTLESRANNEDNGVETDETGNAQEATPKPNRGQGNSTQEAQNSSLSVDESDSETSLELFGQEDSWQGILTAKCKIGISKIKGHTKKDIPVIEREEIKALVNRVKEATEVYDSVASNDTNEQELTEQHQQLIQGIQDQIDNLPAESMFNDQEDASSLIQDLYAHAIPSLVTLLKSALSASKTHFSHQKNTAALQETIQIQSILLLLCQKARGGDAKPTTKSPIIQPTVTIKPLIERMRKAFVAELDDRKCRIQAKIDRKNRKREMEEEKAREPEEMERKKKEIERHNRKIWEEVCEKKARMPGFPREKLFPLRERSWELGDQRVREPGGWGDQWSREQDEALLTALFAPELGELPGKVYSSHLIYVSPAKELVFN